jgi:ElaB/YqjD/DUF883 family membrane-anchored ribosome-binding protein
MAVMSVDSAAEAVKAAGRKAAAAAARHAAEVAAETRQLQTLASGAVDDAREAAARIATRTMRRVEDARDRTEHHIKRAPFTAVAIACGAGILAAVATAWWVTRSRTDRDRSQ